MTINDKNIYENGCACVRLNEEKERYEVYVSTDGVAASESKNMKLDRYYGLYEKPNGKWLYGEELKGLGFPVIYGGGGAYVCEYENEYKVIATSSGAVVFDSIYQKTRTSDQLIDNVRLNKAKRRCDELSENLAKTPDNISGGASDYPLTKAKARCDLLKDGPIKTIKGDEIVYSNGCAAVCIDRDGDYAVNALDSNGRKHIHIRWFCRSQYGDENARTLAIKRCDRIASRGERRKVFADDYPETCSELFYLSGCGLASIVFLLFWAGVAIKSGVLSGMGDDDCILSFPFSNTGLDFFAAHWRQTALLALLPALFGAFFWGLSHIRRFSFTYRLFTKIFGATQAALTAAVWGVFTLYWAIVGLWRAIISPIPDALGYPHFIVATIYLAVIVWGIVDFMKYRKQPAWSAA